MYPLIMAGGTCIMNPAPIEKFLDFSWLSETERNTNDRDCRNLVGKLAGQIKEERLQV